MNFCCENCGWSEIVGSPIMCNYNGHITWRDECCEAWKPKEKETNPTVPSVPLDKLCEWLAGYAEPPLDALTICDNPFEAWKMTLTKWMEEQHDD